MRDAASQLLSKADRIGVVLNRIDAQVGSMTYAGPAADRFRGTIATERDQLVQVARVLRETSDALNRSAARIEADPTGFYGTGTTS